MKTLKIKAKCYGCKKFEVEYNVDINEHGFFAFTEAHCPECLNLLEQIIEDDIKEI